MSLNTRLRCFEPVFLYDHIIHRLIKITDRTLGVIFSRYMCVLFTIILRQMSKGVLRSRRKTGYLSVELQDRERACSTQTSRNSFGLLPQGYYEQNTHKP